MQLEVMEIKVHESHVPDVANKYEYLFKGPEGEGMSVTSHIKHEFEVGDRVDVSLSVNEGYF